MVEILTNEEFEKMKAAGKILQHVFKACRDEIKPGISTHDVDKLCYDIIRSYDAIPSFLNYGQPPFPGTICASVNEEVVHGIPRKSRILKEGDIISVDCGTYLNGFCGDSCYTFCVGEVDEETKKLLQVTKESLYKGIEQAIHGKRLGDIGNAVQTHCEQNGFGVVREFVGHGIGREMHEAPEVPNYGRKGNGLQLRQGMCLAIEPMITLGKRQIFMERDGWTVRTRDRKNAAHFEHTIAVGKNGADILSSFEYVEEVLRNKGY